MDSGAAGHVMPGGMCPREKAIPLRTNEGIQRCKTLKTVRVLSNLSFQCRKLSELETLCWKKESAHAKYSRWNDDVNNAVRTMDMWISVSETGQVFSWQGTVGGQTVFDKPVGRQHCVEVRKLKIETWKKLREKHWNGVEEGQDGTSDEEGDRIDGEEELAAPDWRVRAGPRKKTTQKEREEHEATLVPFRDWCAHCMMGSGRTHHHVTNPQSEDQSRKPSCGMDCYFMNMKSVLNAQTMSEESVTSIAVKEDRHHNIMSSVAWKKGVEEPWTTDRVAKFMDLLGYREITLKSDTEPAIIAFRNRVSEMCKAEVTTENAVKGDKDSNGLIENAVMLIRGIVRTITCHIESSTQEPLSDASPILPLLVEHAGMHPVPIVNRVVTGRRHSNACTDTSSEFRLECETTVQNVSLGMQMVCSELEKSEDWNFSEQMGPRSRQQRNWSTLENDRRQMDSGQTRNSNGLDPNPSIAISRSTNSEGKNTQARHRRSRSHCGMPQMQRNQRQHRGASPFRSLQSTN